MSAMRWFLVITIILVCVVSSARGKQNVDGVWEGEIQDPRRPVVVTADFRALSVSFSGAAPANMTRPALSDAGKMVRFEVVNGRQTLKFAGTKDGVRITGEVDTGSRRIPFWLELPSLPKPANRQEAWRQDIDVVLSRFLRYDRSFSAPRREAARVRLQKLRTRVAALPDAAIIVELARAVATSGNAHTRLYLMRNRTEVRRVPVRVWWFGTELRVVRAATEYADLTGCRVIGIGRWDVISAFRKVRDIKAGNASWQRYMSAYFLTSPDILFGAGVLPNAERLPLTVKCGGRTRRVKVSPSPLRRSSTPVEAWWDLAPGYRYSDAELKSALTVEKAPLYLQHPDRNYWVEYLFAPAIIYLQYNRAQEMSSDPLSDFIGRVTRILDGNPVKGLIIDVRFNTGGDAGVGTEIVETLNGRLKGVPVVVLTGRATFSAGITSAAQWKQFANASIVGEPVGDNLDLWSEGGNLLLPNSHLTVHYANGFHAYSQREYPAFQPYFSDLNVATLTPDEIVEVTWSDYVAGRDALLEAAVKRIRKSR